MASSRPRRRALIGALAIAGVVAGIAVATLIPQFLRSGTPSTRPTPHPYKPFSVEVVEGAGSRTVNITTDTDCAAIKPAGPAFEVCSIAIVADPATIGSEAYGDLNDQRTTALEALIWRARSDADPSVCARGGLLGAFRSECEATAIAPTYRFVDGPVTVVVPRG